MSSNVAEQDTLPGLDELTSSYLDYLARTNEEQRALDQFSFSLEDAEEDAEEQQ